MLTWIRGWWSGREVGEPVQTRYCNRLAEAEEPTVISMRIRVPGSSGASVAPDAPRRARSFTCGKKRPVERAAPPNPSLRRAGLGSPSQRRCLRHVGIRTVDDVLHCDLGWLVDEAALPVAAVGTLRRWRWAIRRSERSPGMRPLDWLLAAAVYRRTPGALKRSDAAQLYRDIRRFAASSRGARLVADHRLPTLDQVRTWTVG